MRIPPLVRELNPERILAYVAALATFVMLLVATSHSPFQSVLGKRLLPVATSTIPGLSLSNGWPSLIKTTGSPAAVAESPPASEEDPNVSLENAVVALRKALVNIFCISASTGSLRSTSGSGIFIDPKGIILTNAHVGQYFLLDPRTTTCVVRAGTPARKQYLAKLIYISPRWIENNPNVIAETRATGTGENDFALLAVTDTATTTPLPKKFPSVRLATDPPRIGSRVAVATYGAQFLSDEQLRRALYPTVVFGVIKDLYTFDTSSIDLVQLGGSAAAQEGSSGGGVADTNGNLVGTVTTSSDANDVSARFLGALTAAYIRGAYASETGQPLDTLLSASTTESVNSFARRIPDLYAKLAPHLR